MKYSVKAVSKPVKCAYVYPSIYHIILIVIPLFMCLSLQLEYKFPEGRSTIILHALQTAKYVGGT